LAHYTYRKRAQSVPFKRKLSCDEKKPEVLPKHTFFYNNFAQKHESFTYKKKKHILLEKMAKK
jgi:hypothetical protein